MKKFLICLACLITLCSGVFSQDTLNNCSNPSLLKKSIVPAVLMTSSILTYGNGITSFNSVSSRNWIQNHYPNFHTSVDNVLQYMPILVVAGLDIGIGNAQNNVRNQALLLAKSELLGNGMTQILKYTVREKRPSSDTRNSYPSGHTTQAFIAATFMHKEYGKQSVWYSVAAYSMATATGAMRILNDRHWLSDVLAGASIGVLSTQVVYQTHQYRWKNSNISLLPFYYQKKGGMSLVYQF